MLELFKHAAAEQTLAALKTLHEAIERCPAQTWLATVGTRAYWEVAYHTARGAKMYFALPGEPLPDTPDWAWPHAYTFGYHSDPPYRPLTPDEIGPPLEQARVAEYTAALPDLLHRALTAETEASLAAPADFPWLKITRAALYTYNARHIQHHAGQLAVILGRQGIHLPWHGTGRPE